MKFLNKIEGAQINFFDVDKAKMSLCGILLDVSGSMKSNIGDGIDEDGEPWAQSIFSVIDDLIEHDLTSKNRVFVIGFGAECPEKKIFDIFATLKQFHEPATTPQINEIFHILEENGARNIRKWATVELIKKGVCDKMAEFVLVNLRSDREFRRKFVYEILPFCCRESVAIANNNDLRRNPSLNNLGLHVIRILGAPLDDAFKWAIRNNVRKATEEDIKEIAENTTKRFLKEFALFILKEIEPNSVISVQDASGIIRGYVSETKFAELSKERRQELLAKIEPFIYGETPLYESLEKATKLFEENFAENKLLFVLSDGEPKDGSPQDKDKIKHYTKRLERAGVNVVTCFITKSTDIHPTHFFDKMDDKWELGAKFLFSLSSKLCAQELPLGILFKRGWTIDIDKNEAHLFIQANHPDNLR